MSGLHCHGLLGTDASSIMCGSIETAPSSRTSELAVKKEIHPEWHPECKVFFRGEEVMTVGATVPELHVEVWSGSHPFFTGKSSFVDTAGRVERFQKKFQGDYFKKKKK
jgi:large subunit ribosomal protein L31